jgi:hypothetical protein
VREIPVIRGRPGQRPWAANLRADSAVFVLEQAASAETGSSHGSTPAEKIPDHK